MFAFWLIITLISYPTKYKLYIRSFLTVPYCIIDDGAPVKVTNWPLKWKTKPILEHYEKWIDRFIGHCSFNNPQIKIKSMNFRDKANWPEFLMKSIAFTGIEESADLMELSKSLSKSIRKIKTFKYFQDVSVTNWSSWRSKLQEQMISVGKSNHPVKIVFKCKENVSIFELAQNYSEKTLLG